MSISRLPASPPFKHLQDSTNRSLLIVLREKVAPILANNLLHHFTDHSVAHSDSLTQFVDQLAEPLQASDNPLSEQELVILYSACYLHDIGMQYENAGSTQAISRLALPQRWEDLSEDTRRVLLRQNHAEISAEMVMMSVRSEAPIVGLQLTSEYYPRYVAFLCEAHTLPTESARYQELTADGPNIRMTLLSGLLRLADILDLSRRRATREKARTLTLDIEAQVHWWRHHYTEEITIDQHQRAVCLWFDFPPEHLSEYSKVVPPLQMPWVEAEFTKHMPVFNRYGIGWTITFKVEQKPYSEAEVMPEAVLTEMLKQLSLQRRMEEERHRYAVVQQFAEAQPQIDRRLSEIEAQRGTLSSGDYLRELSRIATDLWALGGRRSAWMLLSSEFGRGAATLEPSERLEIGMTLATMMVDDDEAKRASLMIKGLLPLADQLPDGDTRKAAFWKLWAKCLTHVGLYNEAIKAIQRAAELTPDEEAREDLEAQLIELHFLHGHIDEALASSPTYGETQ
jgi:hypothetical protein